jgi:hypothetical protein
VSPSIVVSLSKAACFFVGGQPVAQSIVSANVLSLTEEVLKTMFLTKLKLGTALVVCAGLLMTLIGGTLTPASVAQDPRAEAHFFTQLSHPATKTESDEDFIRRTSLDLRGTLPTPTEVHFFLTSKDAGKRQKVIDLFIQERQAKKDADPKVRTWERVVLADMYIAAVASRMAPRFAQIQGDFYKELLDAATTKKELAAIAQAYLDRLTKYVKDHPKAEDVPDAMAQIVMVYSSQKKTVEADAWRAKLQKEYPHSPAARSVSDSDSMLRFWQYLAVPQQYVDPRKEPAPKK